jgi:ParB/RepB/Spo0J family partition protein
MTEATKGRPAVLPVSEIKGNGQNPRGDVDTKGEAFAELVASIKEHGVLQPILVGPKTNGHYPIIAGYRRHLAAAHAGLAEIPALEADLKGAELAAAITENVIREDLNPVDEARAIARLQEQEGLTQPEAGKRLGKSERWVRDRLRLLRVPEKMQQAFNAGAVPLAAAGDVEKLAEKAPKVVEALAAGALDASRDPDDYGLDFTRPGGFAEAVSTVVGWALDDAASGDGSSALGCFLALHWDGSVNYEDLIAAGLPHDRLKEFKAKFAKLAEASRQAMGYASYEGQRAVLTDEDLDAAEAFGCLVTIDSDGRRDARYITDAEWLADRVDERLDAAIERFEKQPRARGSSSSVKKGKSDPEAEKAAKEERRRQREEEYEARVAARAANLELGQRAEKALRSPKPTLEQAKLLASIALTHGTGGIASGLVYTDRAYQTEEELKNGKVKVKLNGTSAAVDQLWEDLDKAKTPNEAFGVALRAFVLTRFANPEMMVRSQQLPSWDMPGRYRAGTTGEGRVPELVREVGMAAGVLPDAVLKAERQKAEAEAEQARIDAEERELAVLHSLSKSRKKAGRKASEVDTYDSRAFAGYFWLNEDETEQLLGELVKAKRVKRFDGEGDPTFAITAAGRKRLEKLTAAAKVRAKEEAAA